MSPFRERSYRTQRGPSRHSRRRLLKKVSQVMLVLGLLCVGFSIVIFGLSFLSRPSAQRRMHLMSLAYVLTGVVLVGARTAYEALRERKPGRRRGRSHEEYAPAPHRAANSAVAPPPPAPPAADQEGMALVMVLILLALVAGLVLNIQVAARTALRREQSELLGKRLQHAAADAALSALHRLADDEDLAVDHTNEDWAVTRELTAPSGISTRVKVVDQNRAFDVNNLAASIAEPGTRPAEEVLMDLLTLCGDFGPVGRVEALRDWTDTDDEGYAERLLYEEERLGYAPPNRAAQTLGELPWVHGFDRAYFERHQHASANEVFAADVLDCVTVVPGARTRPIPLNVNTADPDALLGVLGIAQDALVHTIVTYRNKQPIRSLESVFVGPYAELLSLLAPYLGVGSSVFAVESQAYAEGRLERLRVLARRGSEGRVEILQWAF